VVKSNVCPVCLADMSGEYVEEGDVRISDDGIVCPHCGFVLKGAVDTCPDLDDLAKGESRRGENLNKITERGV